ncbi:hypothetical protein B0I32_15024 [Nonomuraea fuscirosea]|uniref:WD40 repeat protein n=1 Tax=Nonomuraea fuscirosea TaxID=1291556 RepID=A0A2T0LNX2_9ACTN|nr:hypothetical protein B0I32_15024 [Nonomuraea fuscirosea]
MAVYALVALALIAVSGTGPAQPPIGPLPDGVATIVAKMAERPVQFTSFSSPRDKGQWVDGRVWNPRKRAFLRAGGEVTVSPDERWQATLVRTRPGNSQPKVHLLDRKSGHTTKILLPVSTDRSRPGNHLITRWPTWSPNGRRLLLNVFEPGYAPRSEGIVLIDVPSMKSRFVQIKRALITGAGFQWTRDGEGVVVRWGKNGKSSIRQYDLKGALQRTWHVGGRPASQGQGTFSPSGRRFVTACTTAERSACVWDTKTGKSVTRIKLATSLTWTSVLGWYDERHLLAPTRQGVGIVDLRGHVVETLVKVSDRQGFWPRFDARGNG